MPPTSAQADTARIHGIGWLWQSSRASRGDHRHWRRIAQPLKLRRSL